MIKIRRSVRVLGYCLSLGIILAGLVAFPKPALALDVGSYFSLSYSTSFDRTTLHPGESVSATITGTATCVADLPLPVSAATVTGRIVAQNTASGESIVVNASYTVNISSFPRKAGESVTAGCTVLLQFPVSAKPGQYDILGELIDARVKAVLWFSVASYLPASETFGALTLIPPTPDTPGTTDLVGRIDEHGVILENITASSADNSCTLTLVKGTIALDAGKSYLQELRIAPLEQAPVLPSGLSAVALPYALTPENATFNPSATITIRYDAWQIPPGVSEGDLFIAYQDKSSGKWIELEDCTVDAKAHTISARISHFSLYGVIAHTAAASFTVSSLVITPAETFAGQTVSISTTVSNSGDFSGSYVVNLTVDYELKQTRQVTLAGKSSQQVTFNLTLDKAGSFIIGLNEARGILTVKNPVAVIVPPFTSQATFNPPSPAPSQTPAETSPLTSEAPAISSIEAVPVPITARMQPVVDTYSFWLASGVSVTVLTLLFAFTGFARHHRRKSVGDAIMLNIPD